ncbi:hypothetical protein [Pseudomonas shirazensis]
MNKLQSPLYTIDPHIYCSGTILINDIPVIDWYGEETKSGGYLGGIDINNVLLQSGKYKVVGKMFPRNGMKTLTEDEALLIEFFCADADPRIWKSSKYKFHPKIESPWDGLSENINYPYFEIATEIEVELPFVLDGWQNSVDLSKLDKKFLKEKVFEYYRQIHIVLKEHNATKFLELSKEKQRLQEQAFYFTQERKQSFQQSLITLFNQNLELEPLNENELKLEFMGYGKLVRLMKVDGSHPLQFKSPNIKEQSNIELEIKLHLRTAEKGLSII